MDPQQSASNASSLFPSYKEIVGEIGRHLADRKKVLIKRILLIIWPVVVAVLLIYGAFELVDRGGITEDSPYFIPGIIFVSAWTLFTIFYYYTVSIIFAIEKRIWIDSYFDGKNLDPRASWKIARKLFFPTLSFGGTLLVRYYLPPLILYVLGLSVAALRFDVSNFGTTNVLVFGGAALIITYYYYLKIKLRYIWFLFLDLYGTDAFSYRALFQEMKRLNRISRREAFKKALLINLGADATSAITRSIIGILQRSVGSVGRLGRIAGLVARALSEETSRQVISLGKIIAFYLLYRQARLLEHGESQKRNDRLYDLVDM